MNMTRLKLQSLVIACCFPAMEADRVLIVGVQFWSLLHEKHLIGEELMRQGHQVSTLIEVNTIAKKHRDGLRRRGFDVIEYNQMESDNPSHNLTFEGFDSLLQGVMQAEDPQPILQAIMEGSVIFGAIHCELQLGMLAMLKEKNFDLAIVESVHLGPCPALIPYQLQIPFVLAHMSFHPWTARMPALPSFTHLTYTNPEFTDKMSFLQRLNNFMAFINQYREGLSATDQMLYLLHEYAPEIQTWDELLHKASLFIVTIDHHLDFVMPSMPHIIQLPGITYETPKLLPPDLQDLADSATNGIIVFSMGSSLSQLPKEIFEKLMHGFSKVKQTVLARQDVSDTSAHIIPPNVHLLPWLPQNDLLGHQNIKLFITHCGNNGQYEALYHGVPMLGVPVWLDQYENANRVVYKQMGLKMSLNNFTSDELAEKITELVDNPVYMKNIQKVSAILKDRAMSPRKEAAYWVEHVMKHGGEHLRSAALDMPLYAFYMLDILAFVILIALVTILCFIMLAWNIWKCFTRRKLKSKHD